MLEKTLLSKLTKLQNRCIKAISPKQPIDQTKEELKIDQLIQLENCKLWQKHKLNLLPDRLSKNMTKDQHKGSLIKNHRYHTRRHTKLNIPRAHHRLYKNSFLVKGLVIYDKIPTELKTEQKLFTFSKKLKTTLLERGCYEY